jgi:type II secretory ATPase GspE/PulE/Tfp pilus assembly ATPase PilB-like protein
MAIAVAKLKQILTGPGLVDPVKFDDALALSIKTKKSIESVLVERGFISDDHLGRSVADALGLRFADLAHKKFSKDYLKLLPEAVARSQSAIIIDMDAETLQLASSKEYNLEFAKALEKKTGKKVSMFYATPLAVDNALKNYKSDLATQVNKLLEKLKSDTGSEEDIVTLVNLFMEYAHDNGASDIHIEPQTDDVTVRFRIDGVLHEVSKYTKILHDRIVFRIKIMSQLRTDEHSSTQDGRFDFKKGEEKFDVRVSILPVSNGENIVMRLLAERSRRLSLDDLGLSSSDNQKLNKAASEPHGMLLSTGPTGSGKTTTLYAMLEILNKPDVNIMTIEDPVEYNMDGIAQAQVNAKKKLTFSTGLRSIVRQDPDVIMVGEIRDAETAGIAVNAAMTGHLVLSTLHANDAATTFPRITDMGVEPYLVASSVNIIVAQRLARRICTLCRVSYSITAGEVDIIKKEIKIAETLALINKKKDLSKHTFFKGEGCKSCGDTGYSGRVGLFEVMIVTEKLRRMVTKKASSDEIKDAAIKEGMTSMLEDGLRKVLVGVTSLQEVLRATKS